MPVALSAGDVGQDLSWRETDVPGQLSWLTAGDVVVDPRIVTTRHDEEADDSWGQSDDPSQPIIARLVEPDTSCEPIVATLVNAPPITAPPIVASLVAGGESQPIVATLVDDPAPSGSPDASVGIFKRLIALLAWTIDGLFCIASLVVILAVLTAIPLLQLVAFGYLLNVAGRLTQGVKFRDALPNLSEAGMIGMAAVAIFLAALPTQLLVHWESVAYLINPGSGQAAMLRVLAIASAGLTTGYLLWAWIRGGRLRHYLWPQPMRFLREGWRPSTWSDAPDRLWEFTTSFQLPKLFWLGARGAIGTLVWLIPAMIIIAAFRGGETGLAGLVGFVSLIFLGIALLYLPMLQAHFAAENRLSALFEVRTIRRDFRRAPWAWLTAMIIGLVLMPIPLYLLKVEATPREVMWLPCLVFVAFILPARIAEGLALRRARRQPEPSGGWAWFSRKAVRLLMIPVVAVYLLFVYVSQYTSWDGLQTWVQQHAILVPVPFLGGV